jgi:hypothetical protein
MYYPGTLGRRAQRYQPIDQKSRHQARPHFFDSLTRLQQRRSLYRSSVASAAAAAKAGL